MEKRGRFVLGRFEPFDGQLRLVLRLVQHSQFRNAKGHEVSVVLYLLLHLGHSQEALLGLQWAAHRLEAAALEEQGQRQIVRVIFLCVGEHKRYAKCRALLNTSENDLWRAGVSFFSHHASNKMM